MVFAGVKGFIYQLLRSMLTKQQVFFTLSCACALHIQANGGGTHITSVVQLTMLTKVLPILKCSQTCKAH
jgi:hypothetical protein